MSGELDFEVSWGPFNAYTDGNHWPRQYIGSVVVNSQLTDFYVDLDPSAHATHWDPFVHWVPPSKFRGAARYARDSCEDGNGFFQVGKRLLAATWMHVFDRKPFVTMGNAQSVREEFKRFI